jgi:S1-C subfamily serine protease
MMAACSQADTSTTVTGPLPATTPSTSTASIPPATTTAESQALSPQEVFNAVSPALAFIETDEGTGSGVLFDESHLVTNAHVVWPFEEARVVFPDGTEILNAPVTHLDDIADLAIIDLSGAAVLPAPVVLADPGDLAAGSELFLIGYPGEFESFPQPTITQGILSRVRTIDALGFEFLQTDAVIVGGQSGGALVSDSGEVIGISGLGTEGFGLVMAADGVLQRLEGMLAGIDVDGLVERPFPDGPTEQALTVSMDHYWAEVAWVVELVEGEEILIDATSDGDVALTLTAIDGLIEGEADEVVSGKESLAVVAPFDGPYYLVLTSYSVEPVAVELESSHPLRSFVDPDDGVSVTAGETRFGYAEYPGDIDSYLIDLAAGETITISVSAVIVDPDILIDRPGNVDDVLAYDESSGGGLFGTDALLTFTAETEGTYYLVVSDYFLGPGGYVMTIDN